jgi:hypothetical protein
VSEPVAETPGYFRVRIERGETALDAHASQSGGPGRWQDRRDRPGTVHTEELDKGRARYRGSAAWLALAPCAKMRAPMELYRDWRAEMSNDIISGQGVAGVVKRGVGE